MLFAFFNYAAFSRLKVRATLLLSEKTSKEKHGFVAFIKQQVENAEVRLEAKLLLVDLIIRTGLKVSIGQWMLRTDDFTVVGPLHEITSDSIGRYQSGFCVIISGGIGQFDVFFCSSQRGMDIQQLTHLLGDGKVVVIEKLPPLFEEWP